MTSFRVRVLAVMLVVFAAMPAFAQEAPSTAAVLMPSASIGCVFVGVMALMGVGLLSSARESQEEKNAAKSAESGK